MITPDRREQHLEAIRMAIGCIEASAQIAFAPGHGQREVLARLGDLLDEVLLRSRTGPGRSS